MYVYIYTYTHTYIYILNILNSYMDQDSVINTLHLTHLILKKVLLYIFIYFASKETE